MYTSSVNPYQVAPTLSYLETLQNSYTNPTLCIQQGETVFWTIDDGTTATAAGSEASQHYPVYQRTHFLNTNSAFDDTLFVDLSTSLKANATDITSFAFSFFSLGTYVFADAVNSNLLTIIGVLDLTQSCPTQSNKLLQTIPTTLASTNTTTPTILSSTSRPDLTIIWALLGMFLGMAFIIALIAKLKQKKAYKMLEVASMGNVKGGSSADDDTTARNDFKQLYLEIRAQKKHHHQMFNKQREHLRSECDRICAETEQVKALLATKLTEGRGFVDAAINLLLQEVTARNSYGSRQVRREDDMYSIIMTLQRMLQESKQKAHSHSSQTDSNSQQVAIKTVADQVDLSIKKLTEVITESEKERQRKRHLQSNAGIIGDEIVHKLTEHAPQEESCEHAFIGKLKVFQKQCVDYKTKRIEMQNELDDKVTILKDRKNLSAISTAENKFYKKIRDEEESLLIDLERLLNSYQTLHQELKEARDVSGEDENEALESLEQRKLDVEARTQSGIFAGLDEELCEAIKFFLGQARKELLPTNQGMEQTTYMTNMMLGRGFGAGEGMGKQPGEESQQPQQLAPDALVEQTSAELTAAADEEAERVRRQALENVESMNVEELRRLYSDLRQREELMNKLQRSEEERQKLLATELLKAKTNAGDIAPEDEMLLGKAKEMLDSMVEIHRREEEELHAKLKQDEEIRIAGELAALQTVEKSIDQKKAELAAEMARRNELAASESEKTELAHEHEVKLKSLEESLREGKVSSQKVLSKIHDDMRAKLRQAKKEMRSKQKVDEHSVRVEFEKVKEDVEKKIEEKQVKVEGVDLRAIEKALQETNAAGSGNGAGGAGSSQPSAKQQALLNFHLQTQQELTKKHQSEERKQHEEHERDRQKELEELEAKYQEKLEREVGELKVKLKGDRDALRDEEAARVLLIQHEIQISSREAELKNEHKKQHDHLADLLQKRKKEKEQALHQQQQQEMEHEISEQKKEIASIEKTQMKKKEHEALSLVLTKSNYRKAKAIIERLIKPRQQKEVSVLIQENFREAALALNENIEKAIEKASVKKEQVKKKLEARVITPQEYETELKMIEEEVNSDEIKEQTLHFLEAQQNEKLSSQKQQHFTELKELMLKFYPEEKFDGAEWTMEDATINIAALLRESEEKKKAQAAEYEAQLRELERKEQESLAKIEQLKQEKLKEIEERLHAETLKMQGEYEEKLAKRKAEFEEKQKAEVERELEALKKREEAMLQREAEAKSELLSKEEALALEKERLNIEESRKLLLSETEEKQRDELRKLEAERKKEQNMQILKEQEARMKEMTALEENHRANIEKEKALVSQTNEQMKKDHEAAEAKKKESILLAARTFVRYGRQYSEHRELGMKSALRKIRKMYEKVRAQKGGMPFGLVPASNAGSSNNDAMVQVPLQPGMTIIGGGGAVVGENGAVGMMMIPGGIVGAGGMINLAGMIGGAAGAFPGVGDAGQPFFSKLEKIESQLNGMGKSGGGGDISSSSSSSSYLTPGEDSLPSSSSSTLEEVDIHKLTPKKFVLYRFGIFILDFLAEAHNAPQVKLLFAKSLPVRPQTEAYLYANNAFKNSFHYDSLSRTIFVRMERTEEVGEFTLLCIHILSHILSETWSDSSPRFQGVFYKSLQFVCSEFFVAKTKRMKEATNGDAVAPGDASSSQQSLSYKEFRDLFGLIQRVEFKEDLIGEFLDLHHASPEDYVQEEEFKKRFESYTLYNNSLALREHLNELNEKQKVKYEVVLKERMQQKENGMIEMKVGDTVGTKEQKTKKLVSSSAREAASSSARDVLRASIESLQDESDRLHSELLTCLSQISPINQAYLDVQETIAELKSATKSKDSSSSSSSSSASLAEAQSRRKDLQQKLKRMNITKTHLNAKIEQVEEQFKIKSAIMSGGK